MVNVCTGDWHPFNVALASILAVTGMPVLFVAVNELILPLPLAGNPMEVLEFVHVTAAPGETCVKFKAPLASPAHSILLSGTVRAGVGFTVICLVIVVVPHSFVTFRVMVCVPGVL